MQYSDVIKIEKKYDLKSIMVDKEPIWHMIRVAIYNHLKLHSTSENSTDNKVIISNSIMEKNLIPFEYIFFSSLNQSASQNIIEPISKHLDLNKSLVIQSGGYIQNRVKELKKALLYKFNIQNEELLKKILKELNIELDYKQKIYNFYFYYLAAKELIQKVQPKAIFITAHISYLNVLKAAKELKIPVIELQHGAIMEGHFIYNPPKNFKEKYFADYMFVFGKLEKNFLSDNNLYIKSNIFIQGSLPLSLQKEYFIKNIELETIKNKYNLCIGISSQKTIDKKLLIFIEDVARENKDKLFIWIPRDHEEFITDEKNIITTPWLGCYDTIMHCDIHTTVYSTCALESISLGIETVLINIDSFATQFFGYLEELNLLTIADNPFTYGKIINSKKISKLENIELISTTYDYNLNNNLSILKNRGIL